MKCASVWTSIGATALLMSLGSSGAIARDGSGQQELERMIEGRVAGEPVNCVRNFPQLRMRVIDGAALVFERGGVLYVNIPETPGQISERDALRTRTFGTRLCRTDIVTTFERSNGIYTGNISLGEFVPYRREQE